MSGNGKQERLSELLRHPADTSLQPLCMAVLNTTPDSFHDGGRFLEVSAALRQLHLLIGRGADIIDIGGMSSRPGFSRISAEDELGRVLPLLEAIGESFPRVDIPLSIDTDRIEVARAAVDAGVSLLNDCSGDIHSPLLELAAESGLPIVLMHRQGAEGRHPQIVDEVEAYLRAAMEQGRKLGVRDEQFILDPGLGFNKSIDENIDLMRGLPQLHRLHRPLLIGYSHKRFAAALSGEQPGNAPLGNSALAVYSVLHGVQLVRVHEPQQFWSAARAAVVLRQSIPMRTDSSARQHALNSFTENPLPDACRDEMKSMKTAGDKTKERGADPMKKADKIILPQIEVMACHGVYEPEQLTPQPFRISAELTLNLHPAALSDDVVDTVHYGELYQRIKLLAENEHFHLIETLAEQICWLILEDMRIESCVVQVEKCRACHNTLVFPAIVRLERCRQDLEFMR